jgi:phosphate starvation-inducible PhoH-like protein
MKVVLLYFFMNFIANFGRASAFFTRRGSQSTQFMEKMTMKSESSKKIQNKSFLDMKKSLTLYVPKTENQKKYVEYLSDSDVSIVLGIGPAGSGKTLFACNSAVMELKRGGVKKIVLTRPVVPVEEDIGFLPGNLIRKMDPWTRPLFDILLEYYSQKEVDSMLANGVLEISPLAFMRGRTFKNSFIIADEMQNSSPNQMMMLTTRIGDNSKMVITGDLAQSDRGVNNGLADLMTKVRNYENYCIRHSDSDRTNGIKMVNMEAVDVQRSPIVRTLLEIYGANTDAVISEKSTERPVSNLQGYTYNSTIDVNRVTYSIKNDAAIEPITKTLSANKFIWEPKEI